MATSKCMSCFSHAEKRVPKDPTEVKHCMQIEKLHANCKEKWSLSSSKTHERQLMESNCCATPSIGGSSLQCASCGSGYPPAEVTQTTTVGYPAFSFPNQQNTQYASLGHYQNPSDQRGRTIPNQQNQAVYGSFEISGVNFGTFVVPPPPQGIRHRSNSPQRTGEQAAECCCTCSGCIASVALEAACCCIAMAVCNCLIDTISR